MGSTVSRVPNSLDWLWSQYRGWLQHPTSSQSPTIIWPGMTRPSWPAQSTHWSIWRTVCTQSWVMCLTPTYWQQSIPNHFEVTNTTGPVILGRTQQKQRGMSSYHRSSGHMLSLHFRLLLENYVHTTLVPKTILHDKTHISRRTQPQVFLYKTEPTETTHTKQLRQTTEPVLPQIKWNTNSIELNGKTHKLPITKEYITKRIQWRL